MKQLVAVGLGVALLGQSTVSLAAPASQDSTAKQAAYGAASGLSTLVYSPVKGGFCILGAIGSVFTLPFGTKTAGKVVGATCRGTWVISPDNLKGRERVEFIAPMPDAARSR